MTEYIRRQDAVERMVDVIINEFDVGATYAYTLAEDGLNLPSADVVQVVRCDDCVYYGSRRWCELHSSVFDNNAFCSYGERKEA